VLKVAAQWIQLPQELPLHEPTLLTEFFLHQVVDGFAGWLVEGVDGGVAL